MLVTGYDAAGRRLFQRTFAVAPLIVRNDEGCHRYGGALASILMPGILEMRAIPYGGDPDR